MTDISISFKISNTNQCDDLGIEAWIDNHKFFDENIKNGEKLVEHKFLDSDDVLYHTLKFVLKNKNSSHTKIDEQGNILQDNKSTQGKMVYHVMKGCIYT